ncbi:MAG TPA: ABC transporter substrate-binding protein [Pseudonocardiaceae bacterium]|jgi:NitT/TauT family transport system substrate-binding protein|nr:ABC transporter substrate-binding protein [Pseudonocardiaceae bacterium]
MAQRPGGAPLSRLRRPCLSAAAVASVLVVSGCGLFIPQSTQYGSAGSSPPEKPTINVGVINSVDTAPFFIALNKGYFTQQGLIVKYQFIDSATDTLPGVNDGSLDIGWGDWPTVMNAQTQSTGNYKIIADGYQGAPDVQVVSTLPGSGITVPQDLAGKTVGIDSTTGASMLGLDAALRTNNVDPNGITFKVVHFADSEAALQSHQVDAVVQSEPFITKTEQDLGSKAVLDLFGSGPAQNLSLAGWFTTAMFAQKYPDTVAAFQRAINQAAGDAASRSTVEQILPTYTQINAATAALVNLGTWPTVIDPDRLQRVASLMLTYGLTNIQINLTPLIS